MGQTVKMEAGIIWSLGGADLFTGGSKQLEKLACRPGYVSPAERTLHFVIFMFLFNWRKWKHFRMAASELQTLMFRLPSREVASEKPSLALPCQ